MDRLLRLGGAGMGGGAAPSDAPVVDTAEQVYISSLALLKMLKHGRAGHFLSVYSVISLSVAEPGSGAFLTPGSGMEKNRIRDPGWKKVVSGIEDKHPGSATLISFHSFCYEIA
jgi:hypothetical protein